MDSPIDASEGPNTAHQLTNPSIKPTDPGPCEVKVQNLTAKVFLNRPVEDLVPVRFLREAENTSAVQRKPWIFRRGAEDARTVDLEEWSKVDIRYRGVFKTLKKVPRFSKALWDGGCESCQPELDSKTPRAQGQVVYALLNEIGNMLALERRTVNGGIFFLRPRLLTCQMEYWTGYREKYKDGPYTAGFLSQDFHPHNKGLSMPILPVSTTMEEEPLISALEDKFKLMLGQLLLHVRPLQPPGDRLPDQEIFLLGLHGSKMHLMRAFFPGQKTSSLWCRREVPGPARVLSASDLSPSRSSSLSPGSPHASHGEYFGPARGQSSSAEQRNHRNTTRSNSNSAKSTHHKETNTNTSSSSSSFPSTSSPSPSPSSSTRPRSNSNNTTAPRFYAAENIERLRHHLAQTSLNNLDREPNLRTFRILATKEWDLWLHNDFQSAIHILSALYLYLLSGSAQCGALIDTFARNPIQRECITEMQFEGEKHLAERRRKLREDVEREEQLLLQRELEIEEEERRMRRENEEKVRVREAMRWVEEDHISSLRRSRQPWWDFVWRDSEGEEEDHQDDEDGDGDLVDGVAGEEVEDGEGILEDIIDEGVLEEGALEEMIEMVGEDQIEDQMEMAVGNV